ncbi:hypothetical protein H5410_051034, partial [Solanum commersonii]
MAWGILRSPNGELIFAYTVPLRGGTNNQEEVEAIVIACFTTSSLISLILNVYTLSEKPTSWKIPSPSIVTKSPALKFTSASSSLQRKQQHIFNLTG